MLKGNEEIKLGDITPTRDLLFIKDTVNGFIEIFKSDLVGEDVNIASQSEISIGELAQEIINQINPTARIVYDKDRLRPSKSEVLRLLGSNKKITERTNWFQKYSFKDGLTETIDWFRVKDNLKHYKTDIYNV